MAANPLQMQPAGAGGCRAARKCLDCVRPARAGLGDSPESGLIFQVEHT